MLISNVGDLLMSGTDAFIAYISVSLENEYGVQVFDGGGGDGGDKRSVWASVLKRCLVNSRIGGIFPTAPKLLLVRH